MKKVFDNRGRMGKLYPMHDILSALLLVLSFFSFEVGLLICIDMIVHARHGGLEIK